MNINSASRINSFLRITFSFAFISYSLFGCATMFNGAHQNVTVHTMDSKEKNTECTLINEEGTWKAAPSIPVSIHRDGNQMSIECVNDIQKGSLTVESDFSYGYLLCDILLDYGIISGSIDAYQNSFYDYPGSIIVKMNDMDNQKSKPITSYTPPPVSTAAYNPPVVSSPPYTPTVSSIPYQEKTIDNRASYNSSKAEKGIEEARKKGLKCEIKPSMSDEDYYACGAIPPNQLIQEQNTNSIAYQADNSSAREKLQKLKDLKDSDLITNKEYQRLRTKILQELN